MFATKIRTEAKKLVSFSHYSRRVCRILIPLLALLAIFEWNVPHYLLPDLSALMLVLMVYYSSGVTENIMRSVWSGTIPTKVMRTLNTSLTGPFMGSSWTKYLALSFLVIFSLLVSGFLGHAKIGFLAILAIPWFITFFIKHLSFRKSIIDLEDHLKEIPSIDPMVRRAKDGCVLTILTNREYLSGLR